jgi:hypothetical protein
MSTSEESQAVEQLKADVQAVLDELKAKVDAAVTEAVSRIDEAIHARQAGQ